MGHPQINPKSMCHGSELFPEGIACAIPQDLPASLVLDTLCALGPVYAVMPRVISYNTTGSRLERLGNASAQMQTLL